MNYNNSLAKAIEQAVVTRPSKPRVRSLENGYRAWFLMSSTLYCVGVEDEVFWLTYAYGEDVELCLGFFQFWHQLGYDYFGDDNIDIEDTPRWLSAYVRESAYSHFQGSDFSIATSTFEDDVCSCVSVSYLSSRVINFLKENAK